MSCRYTSGIGTGLPEAGRGSRLSPPVVFAYPPENPRSSECRRFRGNSGTVGRVVVGGAEMR